MIDYLPLLAFVVPISIAIYFLIAMVYSTYYDHKNPPKPIHYVWRNIWPDYKSEWERGSATSVYLDPTDNDIRGKVVRQSDGLYLATMWNGYSKEFLFDFEAIKWVEQYRARVYK